MRYHRTWLSGQLLVLSVVLLAFSGSWSGAEGAPSAGREADLELYLSVQPEVACVGEEVEVRILVSNQGPSGASDVVVHYRVPDGLAFVRADPEDATDTYDPRQGLWEVGTIDDDQLRSPPFWSLTITVRIEEPGTYTHEAEVLYASEPDPDSTPGNAVPAEDDTDKTILEASPAAVDLQVTKSDGQRRAVAPGDRLAYTLTYASVGVQASGVVLTETLPEHTRFDAAASTAGWEPDGAAAYRYVLGALDSGTAGTLTFAVVVDAPLPGGVEVLVNTVTITDDGTRGADATPENNVATTETPIPRAAQADLSLQASVDEDVPAVGSTVEVELQLHNDGPDPATDIRVAMRLPEGWAYRAHAAEGVYDSEAAIWEVALLEVGEVGELRLTTTVQRPGALTGTAAVVQAEPADPDSQPGGGGAEEDDAVVVTVIAAMAAPQLQEPANRAAEVALPVVLSWNAAPGARHYEVQVTPAGQSFEDAVVAGTLADTTATVDSLAAGVPYRWRVRARANGYRSDWSEVRTFTVEGTMVSAEAAPELSLALTWEPVFPNPVRHRARLRFHVREQQRVRIVAYDLVGRRVGVLFDGAVAPHQVVEHWFEGSGLASGVYVLRLRGHNVQASQLIFVRR